MPQPAHGHCVLCDQINCSCKHQSRPHKYKPAERPQHGDFSPRQLGMGRATRQATAAIDNRLISGWSPRREDSRERAKTDDSSLLHDSEDRFWRVELQAPVPCKEHTVPKIIARSAGAALPPNGPSLPIPTITSNHKNLTSPILPPDSFPRSTHSSSNNPIRRNKQEHTPSCDFGPHERCPTIRVVRCFGNIDGAQFPDLAGGSHDQQLAPRREEADAGALLQAALGTRIVDVQLLLGGVPTAVLELRHHRRCVFLALLLRLIERFRDGRETQSRGHRHGRTPCTCVDAVAWLRAVQTPAGSGEKRTGGVGEGFGWQWQRRSVPVDSSCSASSMCAVLRKRLGSRNRPLTLGQSN